MGNLNEILKKLIKIDEHVDFSSNRNDARKAYKLLKESDIKLDVEQLILEENIFRIKNC